MPVVQCAVNVMASIPGGHIEQLPLAPGKVDEGIQPGLGSKCVRALASVTDDTGTSWTPCGTSARFFTALVRPTRCAAVRA
jgi:hypothetical protein